MFRFFVSILFFGFFTYSFAQQIKKAAAKPPYNRIYAISKEQAWKLQAHKYKEVFTKDFLRGAVDSTTVLEAIPDKYHKGGYIILSPDGIYLNTRFITSNKINVQVVTIPAEMGLVVKKITGQSLSDVHFYTAEKQVQLKHNGYYYIIPEALYGQPLMVECEDEFFLIDTPSGIQKRIYKDETKNRRNDDGFVLTDKPKYHIGDTVWVKGYFTPSLFPKKTNLKIAYTSAKYKSTTVLKKKIHKDKYGSYTSYFVLPDSLPIDLEYTVYLSQNGRSRYKDFQVEDYKLDDFLLDAEVSFGGKYQDSIAIRVYYNTPQGDPVNSGWISLHVEPSSVEFKKLQDGYIPYSILMDSIQAAGKTSYLYKAKMPTLPYGNYSMELTVQVSNNGLVEEIKRSFEYSYQEVVMTHAIEGHVCTFTPYAVAAAPVTGLALYGKSTYLDTVPVSFPYVVNLQEQSIPTAFVVSGSHIKVNSNEIMDNVFEYNYSIQKNKIVAQIQNPFQFAIRISDKEGKILYQNNEETIAIALPLEKNQLLFFDYVVQGFYSHKRLLVSPDYKSLVIEASLPDTINPGGNAQANLRVTDVENKPVRKANITAVAIDDRLEHSGIPNKHELIQYEYEDRSDQFTRYMDFDSTKDTSIVENVYADYIHFLNGDSINYFLIPKTRDSLTEAFLYVYKDGNYIRPGYVFEDGKPVYFAEYNSYSKQSFYTRAGYHKYEIRLPDETIFIDSIFIYASFKNNILIPIGRIPSARYRSIPRPKRLTSTEKDTMYKYVYKIDVRGGYDLETRSNFYHSLYGTNIIINGDANVYVIFDSATTIFTKSASLKSNKEIVDYLKRQRFSKIKSISEIISISELKTLERYEYATKENSYSYSPIDISVRKLNAYASLYVHEHYPNHTIFKLMDENNIEVVGTNNLSGYLQYIVNAGTYYIQVFNFQGEQLNEQKITIVKSGYYFKEIFPPKAIQTVHVPSPTDVYSTREAYYPSTTIYYKENYSNQYYRNSRSRNRRRGYRSNYFGIYGGLNGIYTNSSTLSSGYQFGGLVGHQFNKHLSGEFRFTYGKTALSMQQPYQYRFGKIGVLAWYQVGVFLRSGCALSLGSGITGQQILDKSIENTGLAIPVGAAVKLPAIYLGLPLLNYMNTHVEVLWNKTISGTDYSYSSNGIWEVNLRFNFTIARQGRVCCPSNFWGGEGDAVVRTPRYRYEEVSPGKSTAATGMAFNEENDFQIADYAGQYEPAPVRSNFYDRAYWIPSFRTDANGSATFNVNYPDALTHWNNYIVAYKRGRSNTWQSQTTTYLNNYVKLYVPRFAIGGDSISATYHVKADTLFTIRNSVNGAAVGESTAADGNYSFYVSKSADTIRCASALFVDARRIDGEQQSVPVYRAGNETYTGSYEFVIGDTLFNFHKPDSSIETKLYVSNNLQDFVRMQYKQLMDYSYSCNEQTASKLIGAIAGKQLNGSYRGNHPQNFYAKLKTNINDAGMYGWWGNSRADVSMSAYVFYALKIYYKDAGIPFDRFYTNLGARLIEQAAQYKVNYFTYWLMKESELPMDNIALQTTDVLTYKEQILALRIRQLKGDRIKRNEIEKLINQTILGNTVLRVSTDFQRKWYDDELMYLILLHKIVKTDFPDIASTIRKGLIEQGSLSEHTPTYVKALFINEFYQLNTEQKEAGILTYDNSVVTGLPFTRIVKDNVNHTLNVKNAAGMYVVKSDKIIQTTDVTHAGLSIDYVFKQNGKIVSSLESGTVEEQIVTLKVASSCSYVMVEIPIAAGCLLEDVVTSCPSLLSHREAFRDKIILYFDKLPEGSYTFSIRQKVLFKGNYQLNPCSVRLMYFPMIQTQTAVRRIKIN